MARGVWYSGKLNIVMWEELKGVSAPIDSGLLCMIRRNDLCSKLRSRLESTYPTLCKILYETECENIDFKQNLIPLKILISNRISSH